MDPQLAEKKQAPAWNVPEGNNIQLLEKTKIEPEEFVPNGVIIESPKQKQVSKDENAAGAGAAEPEPPFSIFSRSEKTFIVIIASLAALFSPLSANIYYPALNILAKDLNVSNSLINLTITSYLIFQGLAPTFIGSLSDETGRRPSYLICFVIYVGACVGLALQNNYAALFVLRCLQSSGSSGTVALANAVIADIVTSAERGTYMGYVGMGALVGPAIGPLIGGLLSQFLGWKAIFWFLTIFAGITVTIIILLFPETCRKVVGNGSLPAQKWNMSLLTYYHLRKQRKAGLEGESNTRRSFKSLANPLNSVYIICEKESGIILLYAGILFAGFYMVLTGLPSQLAEKYHFNTSQIGLCYFSTGFGSMAAAVVVGKFLDWNFRRRAQRLGIELSSQRQQDLTDFPIEAARLQVVLPLVFISGISIIAYGWVMEAHTSLAGPIILLFITTFSMSGAFQGLSTLIVDLNRGSAGSATAAMNLARCWLGAGAVAAVVPLQTKIGIGWTSVLVAGCLALLSPTILVVMRHGPRWRKEKAAKEEVKKTKKEARQLAANLEEGTPEQKK